MSVPGELHALVERFDRDRVSYRSGTYNEAQARVDFINPLLGLLGWDVENREGRPEAYRDVVYEDRVKVGGGAKAPEGDDVSRYSAPIFEHYCIYPYKRRCTNNSACTIFPTFSLTCTKIAGWHIGAASYTGVSSVYDRDKETRFTDGFQGVGPVYSRPR